MAKRNVKIMSLSVTPEIQQKLKLASKKMKMSISELVRELTEKHLNLIVNDGDEIPVILKIPTSLKGNEEELRKWLNIRVEAIINKIS